MNGEDKGKVLGSSISLESLLTSQRAKVAAEAQMLASEKARAEAEAQLLASQRAKANAEAELLVSEKAKAEAEALAEAQQGVQDKAPPVAAMSGTSFLWTNEESVRLLKLMRGEKIVSVGIQKARTKMSAEGFPFRSIKAMMEKYRALRFGKKRRKKPAASEKKTLPQIIPQAKLTPKAERVLKKLLAMLPPVADREVLIGSIISHALEGLADQLAVK